MFQGQSKFLVSSFQFLVFHIGRPAKAGRTARDEKLETRNEKRRFAGAGLPSFALVATMCAGLAATGCSVSHTSTAKGDEVTIKTPAGGIDVHDSADPKAIGLPIYPNSRPHRDSDNDKGSVNMDMFGMKLIVASFDTDDTPDKVAEFYDKDIKKFGDVLQCKAEGMTFRAHKDEWGCEHGEATDIKAAATGGGLELKAGNKNDMHIVAVKPHGSGTEYALVFLRVGKGESI